MSEIELYQQLEEQRFMIRRLDAAHNIQMNNLKKIIFKEALNYIKETCAKVVNHLTGEHHKLIK